jgi:predicted nucleic acid-binding protein
LTISEASSQVDRLARVWPVVDVTSQIVLEATRGVRAYQFSFWDAQIWAAARLNQIPVVFSEDFSDGSVLEGVRFVNPFAEDFQIEKWSAEQL